MSIQFIKKDKIGNIVGENFTLKNSSNSLFEQFKITGNSKQETRKGINLFNKDNISNLANASQGYLVEGTKIKSFFTECKPNTTYSAKRVNPSTDRFSIAFTSEVPADGVAITNIYPNPPNVDQSDNDVVISSTSAEDSKYVCITISNTSEEVPDIMLVEGYYTIDDFPEFESYGASPSSDYPSEIRNTTNINIKICNENILYDGFEEEFINRINSSSLASIVEKNGKKYLKFDASTGGTEYGDLSYFVKGIFKENTQYTFNSKLILSKSMETVNLKYIYTDGTRSYKNLDSSAIANEEFDYSFTSDEGKTIESLSVLYSSGITYMDLSTATIVEGTSTDYIERQSQSFNFPLLEGQELYRDSYLADDGVHHVRNQIELNGTENWQDWSFTNDEYVGFLIDNLINYDNSSGRESRGLCNYFYVFGGVSTTSENRISLRQEGDNLHRIYVCIKKSILPSADLTGFKAWLANLKSSEKPMILEYKLAEEIIEPYTEKQQIVYDKIKEACSYKNVTNIFSLDEVSPIIEVSYKKRINKRNFSSTIKFIN